MVGDRLQTLLIDNEHALTELDSAEDRQQFSMQCLLMAKRRQQHGDDLKLQGRESDGAQLQGSNIVRQHETC